MAGLLLFVIFALSFTLASPKDFALTILHTNDVHAHFLSFNDRQQPCTEKDINSSTCWGGAARRQTALKRFAAADENVLKLDAGDQYQGTIWYTALKWEPIAKYLNLMKYDAMTFGNHEFDDGVQGLEPFVRNLTTPIVVSNINDKGSKLNGLFKKDLVKVVGGEKIGITGCTTADIPNLSAPGPDLEFLDEIQSLRPVVDGLIGQGITKIVVLSHAGINVDREICKKVKGVDIVVGGHTHTLLYSGNPPSAEKPEGPYPEVYSGPGGKTCLVVQDYAYGKYLGRLKIVFDDAGDVKNWSGSPVLLDAKTYPEDPEMVALLQPYKEQLDHYQKTVVTQTAVALDGLRKSCRLKECNLGNIITDAALYLYVKHHLQQTDLNSNGSKPQWSPVAISIWNGGGIRDFEASPGSNLTLNDLYTILPFSNTINKLTINGSTLMEALEHAVTNYDPTVSEGRFLQVSGLKIVYDLSKPNGKRVQEVRVRCSECGVPRYEMLDVHKVYDVVTNTYLTQGGDGFAMLKEKKIAIDGSSAVDIDVVMDYMKTYQPLLTGDEGRIQFADTGKSGGARAGSSFWTLQFWLLPFALALWTSRTM